MIKILLSLFIIFYFVSCSSIKQSQFETATIDTTKVASPTIEDSLNLHYENSVPETTYVAYKVVKHDTVLTVRYYPVYKTVYVKAVPETVTTFKVIPKTVIQKEVEKVPFIQKIGFVSIGLLVGIFLIGVLIVSLKLKLL